MTYQDYSSVYDFLYQDKDYAAETDFLEAIFERYAQAPPKTILDMGCGSGGHLVQLAKRGYEVTGVDRSSEMLTLAKSKTHASGQYVKLHHQDIRHLDLEIHFEAVIAMFAVMAYQISNSDLVLAFEAARRHLQPGGLFVFDCWFGPAVLVQKPVDRYKIVDEAETRLIRFAVPTLDLLNQTVRVDYNVIRLEGDRVLEEISESHLMRFLFPQEIIHLLALSGFEASSMCPFMKLEGDPTDQDWNITVVAKACE